MAKCIWYRGIEIEGCKLRAIKYVDNEENIVRYVKARICKEISKAIRKLYGW